MQVNMPADSFESPLTLAACGGHVELAMLLLERGANIEEVNDEGYTPLMEASREGHEDMAPVSGEQHENTCNICEIVDDKLSWITVSGTEFSHILDYLVPRELTSMLRLRKPRRRP